MYITYTYIIIVTCNIVNYHYYFYYVLLISVPQTNLYKCLYTIWRTSTYTYSSIWMYVRNSIFMVHIFLPDNTILYIIMCMRGIYTYVQTMNVFLFWRFDFTKDNIIIFRDFIAHPYNAVFYIIIIIYIVLRRKGHATKQSTFYTYNIYDILGTNCIHF